MKKKFNFPNLKTKKRLHLITTLIIIYVVALLVSINYAERKGTSWLYPNYASNTIAEKDSSFYTVDVSTTDELTKEPNPDTAEGYINQGEVHHLPNITEFELYLYDALAKNGGYLTEEDMVKLQSLHVKMVSRPSLPVDEFYDFLFQNKDEDYLTQKMMLASEVASQGDNIDNAGTRATRKLTYTTHKVREGQTLWNIAKKYKVSTKAILSANSDVLSADGSNLKIGLTLRIPNMTGIFIKAGKGDTISKIAKKYRIPAKNILIANNKTSEKIKVGEELFLPGAKEIRTSKEQQVHVVITRHGKVIERNVTRSGARDTRWKGYFAWPLKSRIALSSGFGMRHSPFRRRNRRRRVAFHAGIDLRAPRGTPIYAAAPGTVTFSGWRNGYGKTVEITHPNGIKTIYAHCTRLYAHSGQSVAMGQAVGTVGTTGRATGSHLHFEVRVNGIPRNPFNYLK